MGCITSKLITVDGDKEAAVLRNIAAPGDSPHHVVSLTSTTYGALKLETPEEADEEKRRPSPLILTFRKSISEEETPEIINAWELMSDLEDDDLGKVATIANMATSTPAKKISDSGILKPVSAPSSTPRKLRKSVGKENSPSISTGGLSSDRTRALKQLSPIENALPVGKTLSSVARYKNTPSPASLRSQVHRKDRSASASRRRSLTPMFDPELVASFEKELLLEKEQIKTVISSTPRNRKSLDSAATALLESYESLCPRGGAESVILYTTTLRGIRKTFEDCNVARAAIEGCGVQFVERDISMDSGYREELRMLMGKNDVRIPLIFVKGRFIGGAAEILKLEDSGKLELLLTGIPRAALTACDGCGGVRFVLCIQCCGSSKLRDVEEGNVLKCGDCNENGLIHCPVCC